MQGPNHLLFEKSKDYALDYMRTINQRSVYPPPEALRALRVFREAPPEGPTEAGKILDMLHQFGSPATIAQTGARYFGFVNGGAIDVALAAKWLADVWDQNAAMYVLSPIAAVLESVCEEWLVDFLGLPNGTAAGFVGGTSIGTLTGLAAGRDELLRRLGWNASARGLFGAPEIRVVLGAQAHASFFKALSLLGLGRERIIHIPSVKAWEQARLAKPNNTHPDVELALLAGCDVEARRLRHEASGSFYFLERLVGRQSSLRTDIK